MENVANSKENLPESIKQEKILGIKGQHIFDTNDERYASLYVVVGIKR